ncbi:hypothetical protein QQS21_007709 [Conoideocrella luteorostrata]|uniref:Uncharacterized protein n=1 Tax=Conoideocrella luteorostrata TaxID=1105319 RepID=A0AAJ0CKC3_9HYPO|nr:hypothetical protein QQS21_007709 [Conoideocrella luteorostrata]
MKFSLPLASALLSLASVASAAPGPGATGATTVQQLVGGMKTAADKTGFRHFGSDGVVRSLDANFKVVDYLQLTPIQIAELVADLPSKAKAGLPNLAGVDGRKTPASAAQAPTGKVLDEIKAGFAKSKAAVSKNPAVGVLEQRSCGTEVCSSDSDCHTHGCIGCIIVYNGIGFCYGF